jgi:hypothetical protein
VRNHKTLLVRRDAGRVDVGAQRLSKRVMARHHVLLATFLVQPDQPAVPLDCRSSTRILSAAPTRAKP